MTRQLSPRHGAGVGMGSIFSFPFKGGEAGIRDACVAPPQPAGCAKPAVGRAAAGYVSAYALEGEGASFMRLP